MQFVVHGKDVPGECDRARLQATVPLIVMTSDWPRSGNQVVAETIAELAAVKSRQSVARNLPEALCVEVHRAAVVGELVLLCVIDEHGFGRIRRVGGRGERGCCVTGRRQQQYEHKEQHLLEVVMEINES